jgi:hypothetical protein
MKRHPSPCALLQGERFHDTFVANRAHDPAITRPACGRARCLSCRYRAESGCPCRPAARYPRNDAAASRPTTQRFMESLDSNFLARIETVNPFVVERFSAGWRLGGDGFTTALKRSTTNGRRFIERRPQLSSHPANLTSPCPLFEHLRQARGMRRNLRANGCVGRFLSPGGERIKVRGKRRPDTG